MYEKLGKLTKFKRKILDWIDDHNRISGSVVFLIGLSGVIAGAVDMQDSFSLYGTSVSWIGFVGSTKVIFAMFICWAGLHHFIGGFTVVLNAPAYEQCRIAIHSYHLYITRDMAYRCEEYFAGRQEWMENGCEGEPPEFTLMDKDFLDAIYEQYVDKVIDDHIGYIPMGK